MNRFKRLLILLGVLAVACAVTFGVSRYQEAQEQIRTSGETILEIDPEEVQALSWELDGVSLAFHKDGTWLYDEDEAFPVDEEKIGDLLALFQPLSAAFVIEEPEDLSAYGLDDPEGSIELTTGDTTCTIQLGGYSVMDSQRYLSLGDGNVYLVETDPVETFSLELSDLILQDELPDWEQVTRIAFSGASDLMVTWQEEGGNSYREEDVYFADQAGESLPLDTDRVEDYLSTLRYLDLTDYVTYNATEEELADCGLDAPELTVELAYTAQEDGQETTGTVTLSVSRDPSETAEEGEDESAITAYARVGDSPILYQITGTDYTALLAAGYDDLRHTQVLPAEVEDLTSVEIQLEDSTYTLAAEGSGEDKTFSYEEQELETDDFRAALEGLTADSFTDQQPEGKQEIALTLHLDKDGEPTVEIGLYRLDGEHCLAVVDGEPVSLVPRSQVVDLIEAVNAIVLN